MQSEASKAAQEWLARADRDLGVAAQTLSPYVVRFRYPLGPLEPDMAEAEEAVRLAREIVQFVRDRLSPGSLS